MHPLLLAIGSERYWPFTETQRPQELLTQANAILGQGQLSLAKFLLIANHADDSSLDMNIEDLIAGARKEFPDLFKTKPGKADGGGDGARGKPNGKTTVNDWIRQSAGRAN